MSNKKKIGVVINSLGNGGAEKQSVLLAKALQDHYETYLVVLKTDEVHPKHQTVIDESDINLIPMQGNLLSKGRKFRSFLKEKDINVLFSYLPFDTVFSGVLGKMSGVRHLYGGIRNAAHDGKKLQVMKYVHNHVLDYSISNSHAGLKPLIDRGFDEGKLMVLPNGIEVKYDFLHRPDKEKKRIITVGRFVEQKGYYTALQTMRYLLDHYPDVDPFTYRIVGYGKLEVEIKGWISDMHLEDVVEVVVNPPNMPEQYQESDIYFCSSLFEGLSNTVMESMIHSLPVVATDAGDNNVLVREGANGHLVEIGDVDAMAERLYQLISSYEKRIQFGKDSYEFIQENYSFQAFQRNYLALVQHLN